MIGRRFGLLGAAGYIAPRHMAAIKEVGGVLVAACDPHDSVGVLDSYFPDADFYTDTTDFRRRVAGKIDVLSICTPNHLHTPHTAFGFGAGADVICEKPLALSVAEARALQTLEQGAGRKVWTVLQLRHLPAVQRLWGDVNVKAHAPWRKVKVEYVTRRGRWYGASWKGDDLLSGGVVANVGSHLFDLLAWVFADPILSRRGPPTVTVSEASPTRVRGTATLYKAEVEFLLSLDPADLPAGHPGPAHRVLTIDGVPLDLTGGGGAAFTELHTEVYRSTLAGAGWRISDAMPGIALVQAVREAAARLGGGTP